MEVKCILLKKSCTKCLDYLRNAFSIAGIFSEHNDNADQLDGTLARTEGAEIIERSKRRKLATEITRQGEKFWKYNIVTTINHGLARQNKPLPSGIPIQITFNHIIPYLEAFFS